MKHILVPTDFSKPSAYALQVAAIIAKQQQADITVLHMMGISEALITEGELQEFKEAKYFMGLAKKRFKTFLDQPFLKGIKTNEVVQNYKIFSEIKNIAKEQNIDLIVMGSHGSTGFNEFFVGSNTEKVVRTSDVPVLVIKQPQPDFKVRNILFGCSFGDDMIAPFKIAKKFAETFSATLKLLYVNTPFEDFLSTSETDELISKFMSKAEETNYIVDIYNDYGVEHGLLNFCKTGTVDVLALPTHGRKGLSHFLIGSVGEDVANHANLPVLTIKI